MTALLFAAASQRPTQAITIDMEYSTDFGGDESPGWDSSGSILKAHFQRAKQIWEALLPGPGDYQFDFQWDDDIDGLGLTTDSPIDTFVEINPDWNWFADPTPGDSSEFDVSNGQTLYGELSLANRSYFPGTAPPDALEVGFRGTGLAGATGAGGSDAKNGYDLLSTVVHEMGHILGIGGDILGEPGEFNIDPQHVGGLTNVLVQEDEGGGHLAGHGDVPFLMCESCGEVGVRRFPTATDVLVIAEDQGISDVHLERVGSISSGFWSEPNRWIGGAVPDMTQDAYIRNFGTTTLDADQQVRNLRVTSGSSVVVQNHRLTVGGALSLEATSLSVGSGGTLVANSISVSDPGAIITTAGSLVRFNSFTSASASAANFNGNVAIGYDILSALPGASLPAFDPKPNSVWHIAGQLAVGDANANSTSTLAINEGAKFYSSTGQIGATVGANSKGSVVISGDGSLWTTSGVLDARTGSLVVADQGLLTTGAVALGAGAGQMNATVNGAVWNVNGHVEIGPPTLTGFGRGLLTVKNGGRMSIAGNLNVHGTSETSSEVMVESGGSVDVDGYYIVGAYGKVTYSDNTSADNKTYTNLGSGEQDRLGGVTQFDDTASAGNGVIINNGGTAIWGYGGLTRFNDSSSALFATITNDGPSGLYAFVGKTVFNNSASAGFSTITNLPSTGGPTTTDFYGTSTAESATIINRSGPYATVAGVTTFHDSSTAGNGTFINDSALSGGNGEFVFKDSSTAGQGTFTNGSYGGYVTFRNNSTAGQAHFSLRATGNCLINFYDNSSADAATIDVGPVTYQPTNEFNNVNFYGASTAANANITVRGDGGSVRFAGATAGNATIVAMGSTRPGNIGGTVPGQVLFDSLSTAGNATVTAQPSSVAGAPGGIIVFLNGGHAGAATLIANGGATAVNGGGIRFQSAATGDSARLVVNAGAYADFSLNSFYAGTAVGSIEGAGRIHLGGSLLTVGNLNTSTAVSGDITDAGGYYAGTGGRLTKVGTGTLTLSGANAYSGLTTVDEGSLVNDGSLAAGVVVKDGGILKGIGSMGPVVVEAGGTFSPGTSPGTITVGGLDLMSGSTLNYELGSATRDRIVVTGNGNVTLGGVLNLSVLPDFNPPLGQVFSLFEGAVGSITGTFSTVNAPTFNGHALSLLYGVNQVTLQVGDANFLAADFTEDGSVNGNDLARWRANFGSGATHMQGDADGDLDVDGAEFLTWQRQLGSNPLTATSTSVPEPAALTMVLLASWGATLVRPRRSQVNIVRTI